jgi:hypothetical protein
VTTFTEGENCFFIRSVEDYRQLATVIILKAGKDDADNDIVVTASNFDAMKLYGRRPKIFSETQWRSETLAQLRALQLLDEYSTPKIIATIDVEPQFMELGESLDLVAESIAVDDTFFARSIDYKYRSSGESMILELSNRMESFGDLFEELRRQIDKR